MARGAREVMELARREAPAVFSLVDRVGRESGVRRLEELVGLSMQLFSPDTTRNEALLEAREAEAAKWRQELAKAQTEAEASITKAHADTELARKAGAELVGVHKAEAKKWQEQFSKVQASTDTVRTAEAARWKDQLAKTHAEVEAARKRGAELTELHKAALEQNKQLSGEMRALRDLAESNFLPATRGRRGEQELGDLFDEWNASLELGLSIDRVHAQKHSGDLLLTRAGDAKVMVVDSKNLIADTKKRTLAFGLGVEKLTRDALSLLQNGTPVAAALLVANARISAGDRDPIEQYRLLCPAALEPLGVGVHCLANAGERAATPWEWDSRLLTVLVEFAVGGRADAEHSAAVGELEGRNREAIATLQRSYADLTSRIKDVTKLKTALEKQQDRLRKAMDQLTDRA